jgi:hypothetical protein
MDSQSRESGGLEPAIFKDLQTQILTSYQYVSNKKALNFFKALSGMDGTRTRDLLRDRQAF